MNTTEGNKLIAKFMEFPTRETAGNITDDAANNFCAYHKSWDLLVPVINRIWTVFNHSLTMNNGYAYWLDVNGEQISYDSPYGFENIEKIWEFVIEHLTEYFKS